MVLKHLRSYSLVILSFFIYSISNVLVKFASYYDVFSVKYWLLYTAAILVLTIYAFIWQKVLKTINLFAAYSAKGMTIVFALVWSIIFFSETVSLNNIIGSIVIIIGIVVVYKNAS